MASFIQQYLDFVLRPLPEHASVTGIEVNDNFNHKLLFWTFFFTIIFLVFEYGGKWIFRDWHRQLSERKRREYAAYATCLVHHFVMVPRAWIHILNDFRRTSSELAVISYPAVEATIAPFCLGYLLGDTICYAIPELLRGNLEYIIHHVMTGWLVYASLFVNGHLLRFIPHLLICDTTNVFFNTAWLMRTVESLKGSSLVTVLELSFAFFFLIARVINMPLAFYAIYKSKYSEELGFARITFIPIAFLQWFWFYKIILGISSRFGGTKAKSDAARKDKRLINKTASEAASLLSDKKVA